MSNSAHLDLPYLQPSQAQKHVTHNEALRRLDALVQLRVQDFDVTTPPPIPAAGDAHALGAGPSGVWAGQDNRLAVWDGAAWDFIAPKTGWRAWGIVPQEFRVWDGTAWVGVSGSQDNLDHIGINTTADATNRLSVRADATLLSHEGTDHRLTVNKAGAPDTAALLFQSGWTGHAEIGLAGNNDLSLKVSADGSAWTEALVVDAASGHLSGEAVQASSTDTTPGRLARADYAYGPGNVVGSVGQSGGVPTGAVVERGSNANGDYMRFADGTQICLKGGQEFTEESSGIRLGAPDWIYPASFAASPYLDIKLPVNTQSGAGGPFFQASTDDIRKVSCSGGLTSSTSAGSMRIWAIFGTSFASGASIDCDLFAIGRWF